MGRCESAAQRWFNLLRQAGVIYADAKLSTIDRDTEAKAKVAQTLEKFCGSIAERVHAGQGLVLFGPVGAGKDFRAMAVAREAIRNGLSLHWLEGRILSHRLFDGDWTDDLLEDCTHAEILYVADPPLLNQQAQQRLGMILDSRFRHGRPVWATVNVNSRAELIERIGADNADRLLCNVVAVHCDWPSGRKTAAIDATLPKPPSELPETMNTFPQYRPRYTPAEPRPVST